MKKFEYRFDETRGFNRELLENVFNSKEDIIDYFNNLLDEYYISLNDATHNRCDETTERYHKNLDHYNLLLTIGTNIFKIWLPDYKKC